MTEYISSFGEAVEIIEETDAVLGNAVSAILVESQGVLVDSIDYDIVSETVLSGLRRLIDNSHIIGVADNPAHHFAPQSTETVVGQLKADLLPVEILMGTNFDFTDLSVAQRLNQLFFRLHNTDRYKVEGAKADDKTRSVFLKRMFWVISDSFVGEFEAAASREGVDDNRILVVSPSAMRGTRRTQRRFRPWSE